MSVVSLNDRRQPSPVARPGPANIELEQAVLGCIMLNNGVLHAIGPRLEAEHFSEDLHRRIFEVASTLIRDGKVASPITLKTFLGDHEISDGVSIHQYMITLLRESVSPIQAPDYARAIIDLHGRRQLLDVAKEIEAQAYDPPAGTPFDRLIDGAEAALTEVRGRYAPVDQVRSTAGELGTLIIDKTKRILSGEEKRLGVRTGIPDLDRDTSGMQPGTLWVVAGRPGMGKSILGTKLAQAGAHPKSGSGAILFSLEVPRDQIIARILSDMAYVPHKSMTFGQIMRADVDADGLWRLEDAQRRLAAMPLVIDYSARLTVSQIASRVRIERERMAKAGIKLGVVVIDYLKFVAASDRYQGQRHYEVGEISAGLRQIAKDQDVCVVLLAQLNRAVESRDDKRPTLADLRESGDLEADADVVGFVYRDAYYIEQSAKFRNDDPDTVSKAIDARDQMDLIIGKNRAGATKTHNLWCDIGHSAVAAQARGGL